MPLDFASQTASIARQRKLAEMLQQQAFAPSEMPTDPRAKMSWLHPLAKALGGGLSAWQADKADAADKAMSESIKQQRAEILGAPDGSAPGVPSMPIEQEATVPAGPPPAAQEAAPPLAQAFGPTGMPNVGPRDNEFKGAGADSTQQLAQLLGGPQGPQPSPLAPPPPEGMPPPGAEPPPMLPRVNPVDMAGPGMKPKLATDAILPKLPTAESFRTKGEKLLALGDPTSLAMGKEYFTKGVDADAPMTRKEEATIAETRAAHIAQENQRIEELRYRGEKDKADRAQRELDEKRRSDDKRYTTDENNETRRILAQAVASRKGDGEGGKASVSGGHTNIAGDLLAWDGKKFINTRTGQEHIQTEADPIIEKGDRKEILDTTKLLTSAADSRDMAGAIRADEKQNPGKGAYSGGNNFRAYVSAATAGIVDPAERMKAEQQILRSNVTRDIAAEMHSLYGASFTTSEQKQASDIMKMPFASGEQMARKLEAQANFREQMARAHSPKAITVAEARVKHTRSKRDEGAEPPAAAKQYTPEQQKAMATYGVKG